MKKNKPVALFIGRFQPFHCGHLSALRWIAVRSSKVIVAIGSAQKSFEPENPFTIKEREKMIRSEIGKAAFGKRCAVVPITDVNDNDLWVSHLEGRLPAFEVVFSNNALVKRLMKRAGKKVSSIPFFRRDVYDATKIRGMMKRAKRWQDRVPIKVRTILKRMNAEERVKNL